MALSTNENTPIAVMENFKKSGMLPDYVNINNLNLLSVGQVILTLDIFGDKQSRIDGEKFDQVMQGVNLPDSKIAEIKETCYSILYPYLIAEIQVMNLIKERDNAIKASPENKESIIESYELKIKDIYIDSGLDSPF